MRNNRLQQCRGGAFYALQVSIIFVTNVQIAVLTASLLYSKSAEI